MAKRRYAQKFRTSQPETKVEKPEKKVETNYFFPKYSITIKAENLEEAKEKLLRLIHKKDF